MNQQLVRRRNILHIRRIGISRPYEKRNGRPAEFLVFAKPHHATEPARFTFGKAVFLLPRKRVRITESRRIVLRIGPSPATTSNHVKRIMRQHIIGIVLPRHKNEQERIWGDLHIPELPLERLRLRICQEHSRQVDRIGRSIENFDPARVVTLMVFVPNINRIDLGKHDGATHERKHRGRKGIMRRTACGNIRLGIPRRTGRIIRARQKECGQADCNNHLSDRDRRCSRTTHLKKIPIHQE